MLTPISDNMLKATEQVVNNNTDTLTIVIEPSYFLIAIKHPSNKWVDAMVRNLGEPRAFYRGLTHFILLYSREVDNE